MEKAELVRIIIWGSLIATVIGFLSGWGNIKNRLRDNWGWIAIASGAGILSCWVVAFATMAIPTIFIGSMIGDSQGLLQYTIYLPVAAATYLVAIFGRSQL